MSSERDAFMSIRISGQPGEMDRLAQMFSGFRRFGRVLSNMVELLQRVKGKVFYLQLIATLFSNDVSRIYTFNRVDFVPFPELEVLTL